MAFPVPHESWVERITSLRGSFIAVEAFPPLIVEYIPPLLSVSDGNHRLGAFLSMGVPSCWAVLWAPADEAKAHADMSGALASFPACQP